MSLATFGSVLLCALCPAAQALERELPGSPVSCPGIGDGLCEGCSVPSESLVQTKVKDYNLAAASRTFEPSAASDDLLAAPSPSGGNSTPSENSSQLPHGESRSGLPSVDDVFGEKLSGAVEDLTNGVADQLAKGHNSSQQALEELRARMQGELLREEAKQAEIETRLAELRSQISTLKGDNLGIAKEITTAQLDNGFMHQALVAMRPRVFMAVTFINESIAIVNNPELVDGALRAMSAINDYQFGEGLLNFSAGDASKSSTTQPAPETAAPTALTTASLPATPAPTPLSPAEPASTTPAVPVATPAKPATTTQVEAMPALMQETSAAASDSYRNSEKTQSETESRTQNISAVGEAILEHNDTKTKDMVDRLSARLASFRAMEKDHEDELKAQLRRRMQNAIFRTTEMKQAEHELVEVQKQEVQGQQNLTAVRGDWNKSNEAMLEQLVGVKNFFGKVATVIDTALLRIGRSNMSVLHGLDGVAEISVPPATRTESQGLQLLQVGRQTPLDAFMAQAVLLKQRLVQEEIDSRANVSSVRSDYEVRLQALNATNDVIDAANQYINVQIKSVEASIRNDQEDIKRLQRRLELFKEAFYKLMHKFTAVARFLHDSAADDSALAYRTSLHVASHSFSPGFEGTVPDAPEFVWPYGPTNSSPGEKGTSNSSSGEDGATDSFPGEKGTTTPSSGGEGTTNSSSGMKDTATSSSGGKGTTNSSSGEQGTTTSSPGDKGTTSSPPGEPSTAPPPTGGSKAPTGGADADSNADDSSSTTTGAPVPTSTTTAGDPVPTPVASPTASPSPGPPNGGDYFDEVPLRDPATPLPTLESAQRMVDDTRLSSLSMGALFDEPRATGELPVPGLAYSLMQEAKAGGRAAGVKASAAGANASAAGANASAADAKASTAGTNASAAGANASVADAKASTAGTNASAADANASIADANASAADAGSSAADRVEVTFETAQTPEELLSAFASRVELMNEHKANALASLEASYTELAGAAVRKASEMLGTQGQLNHTLMQATSTLRDVEMTKLNMVSVDDVLYMRLESIRNFAAKLSNALDAIVSRLKSDVVFPQIEANSTDAMGNVSDALASNVSLLLKEVPADLTTMARF